MIETPRQIAAEIEGYKDRLDQDLHDLESQVKKSTDWHTYYQKNPWLFVATAVGGGLLLSELFGPRRSSGIPASSSQAGLASGASDVVSDVLASVKVALVGFGTAKAKEFLSDVLPGFEEHMRQTDAPTGSPR